MNNVKSEKRTRKNKWQQKQLLLFAVHKRKCVRFSVCDMDHKKEAAAVAAVNIAPRERKRAKDDENATEITITQQW